MPQSARTVGEDNGRFPIIRIEGSGFWNRAAVGGIEAGQSIIVVIGIWRSGRRWNRLKS